MKCIHCGHTHMDEDGQTDIDFCRQCDPDDVICRDFDW